MTYEGDFRNNKICGFGKYSRTNNEGNIDMIGYFYDGSPMLYGVEIHKDKNEVEIAYLGLLEEYQEKRLGSCLLSSAIKNSFEYNPQRVWVHTCSLDHKNALTNYIARGMKIFKKETITI